MWGPIVSHIVSPTLCYFYYDCLFIDSSFNTQVPWGQKLDFICYYVHHPGTRILWKSSGDKCVVETWEAIPCTFKLWLLVFIQIIPVWSPVLCLSGRGRETSEFQVSLVCLQRALQPSQDCGVRPWHRKKRKCFCVYFLVLSSGEGTDWLQRLEVLLSRGLTNPSVNRWKPAVVSQSSLGVGWGQLQNQPHKMSFGLGFVFYLVLGRPKESGTCF